MKKVNLQEALETFASQQTTIVDREAHYEESDPYDNID